MADVTASVHRIAIADPMFRDTASTVWDGAGLAFSHIPIISGKATRTTTPSKLLSRLHPRILRARQMRTPGSSSVLGRVGLFDRSISGRIRAALRNLRLRTK